MTAEHTLIGKLTASGMTYDQIAELADDSSADADSDEDDDSDSDDNADYQTSFFDTVITKDLSRLGHDYLKTGELIDVSHS